MLQGKSDWPANEKGYKIDSVIGSGYFGKVWKAQVLEGMHQREYVAIKKIDLEKCADNKIEEIRKNLLLLNLLDHPNILSYKVAFISSQELWLVFEYMEGGSIANLIRNYFPKGIKDQALIATIIKEALNGIKYLHENHQIHRDIKGGNILLGSDGGVKISDFGVCAKLKKGQKRNTFIGSPCYMAPEVLDQDGKNGYDSKADIWSLGITALELAYGNPPNSELTTMKMIIKTINEEPPQLIVDENFDESFQLFISDCLTKNPSNRKTADELIKTSKTFFSKAKGPEYIQEKLLRNRQNIIEVQNNNETNDHENLMNKSDEIKSKKINLNFDMNLEEEDSQDFTENIQMKQQNHLSKGDSEYFLKKSLSAKSVNEETDILYLQRQMLKPSRTESQDTKTGPNLVKSNFLQKERGEKLTLSKGDEFSFLPEEEI